MNKSEQVHGRCISLSFWIKFTPPKDGELGDTDNATEIGRGLIKEAMLMLKNTGEAEGFIVEIEARQLNY